MHVLSVGDKPECSVWINAAMFGAKSTHTGLDTKDPTWKWI